MVVTVELCVLYLNPMAVIRITYDTERTSPNDSAPSVSPGGGVGAAGGRNAEVSAEERTEDSDESVAPRGYVRHERGTD